MKFVHTSLNLHILKCKPQKFNINMLEYIQPHKTTNLQFQKHSFGWELLRYYNAYCFKYNNNFQSFTLNVDAAF